MSPRIHRLSLDTATALLAIAGVILVVIGGGPPQRSRPEAADVATAPADAETQGPPGPGASTRPRPTDDDAGRAGPAASAGQQHPGGAQPAALGRSEPVRLAIPAIGVNTALVPLGLNADGTVAVPPLGRDAPAGWYRYLATPGEVGPAVLLGHVDSRRDGPAVFFRLTDLRPGDSVSVRRADGLVARFTVTTVESYEKAAFPTDTVYGALDRPGLRLVTCGGTFDKIHREYRGNVVAYATYTGSAPA